MARERGTGMPTALKMIKGTRTSRINHDEPQPESGVPTCPTDDPDVREIWDYTIKQLLTMRTITMADRDTLHAYCEQVLIHRRALELMKVEGAVVEGPRGATKHPAVSIARESALLIKSLGGQFGLTPGARSSIKVSDQQVSKAQGAARLLSG
jgi:P27 family predicted phage terminase small subunit